MFFILVVHEKLVKKVNMTYHLIVYLCRFFNILIFLIVNKQLHIWKLIPYMEVVCRLFFADLNFDGFQGLLI